MGHTLGCLPHVLRLLVFTVFSLSDKGLQARQAEHSSLPGELRQLLHLVDGQRTRGELIAALHKSTLVAGGLRWLEASGYIKPHEPSEPASRPAEAARPADNAPAGTTVQEGDAHKFHALLSRHMLRAIKHWQDKDGQEYRRLIKSAKSVEELLPYLRPLTDRIAARVSAQAGADFAENAAFILERLSGRTVRGSLENL